MEAITQEVRVQESREREREEGSPKKKELFRQPVSLNTDEAGAVSMMFHTSPFVLDHDPNSG